MFAVRKALLGGAQGFRIVGFSTNVVTSYGTSINCTQHANTKPGDLLFAYVVSVASAGTAIIGVPSGWDDKTGTNSGSQCSFRMLTRSAVAGTSTYNFPLNDPVNSNAPMGVVIVTLRKALHEPVSATPGSRTTTGNINAPSVTSAGGGLLINMLVQGAVGGGASTAPTFPASVEKLFSLPIGTLGYFGLYVQKIPAGATGTRTYGVTLTGTPVAALAYATLFKKA